MGQNITNKYNPQDSMESSQSSLIDERTIEKEVDIFSELNMFLQFTTEANQHGFKITSKGDSSFHSVSDFDDLSYETWENMMQIKTMAFIALKKANCFQKMVSQNRRRFRNEEFDLDLAYITKRTIAMACPTKGAQTIYRNPACQLKKYFMNYYCKYGRVKIYNFCEEETRQYDARKYFGGDKIKVAKFPFKDHQPCKLEKIYDFCVDAFLFLLGKKENVIAVHCKAGKGRTGLMLCAFMLFTEVVDTSFKAKDLFNKRRTMNNSGLKVPSQLRYLEYFESFLEKKLSKPYISSIQYYMNQPDMFANLFVNYRPIQLRAISLGPFTHSKPKVTLKISTFDTPELLDLNKKYCGVDVNKRMAYVKKGTQDYYYIIYELDIKKDTTFLDFDQDIIFNISESKEKIQFATFLNSNAIIDCQGNAEKLEIPYNNLSQSNLNIFLPDHPEVKLMKSNKQHKNKREGERDNKQVVEEISRSLTFGGHNHNHNNNEEYGEEEEESKQEIPMDYNYLNELLATAIKEIKVNTGSQIPVIPRKMTTAEGNTKIFRVRLWKSDLDKFKPPAKHNFELTLTFTYAKSTSIIDSL